MDNSIITLYHGTTHDFTGIDVGRGKPFKDFGQGFYLTAVRNHAMNLAWRNRRIEENRLAMSGDKRKLSIYLYTYEFDPQRADKLNVKRFDTANREWLKFVVANRASRTRQHNFDIVIGPTANDDTRTSIRAVTSAANGAILNDTALNLLLELLEPDNLPTQYFFGTGEAVKLLEFKGRIAL